MPQAAAADPDGIPGAEVMITSDDSTNAVGITLVLLADAASTPQAFADAVANLTTVRATGTPASVPVGDQAVAVAGTSPDGTKATTALVFRYDRALARIDFYSLPGNPTPTERVIDVGQKQAVALRLGLIALGATS
ncbi:MAG: hypothetical protein K0R68_3483 [Mycobacterium sp.]|nr:hypothetical protein [Mycobacterium sp.]